MGEEDMEWLKENLLLEQLNAAIAALGTEEVIEERARRFGATEIIIVEHDALWLWVRALCKLSTAVLAFDLV